MKLYLPITVDLYNIYPLKILNLQQNNIGRGALITLTAAGVVVVPESEGLYVYAKKSDGTVVYNTCVLQNNQIQVDFDEQMTVESGILQVELQMVDTSGNSITTPIFQVNVQKTNIDYQKIVSSDSFRALIDALTELKKIIPYRKGGWIHVRDGNGDTSTTTYVGTYSVTPQATAQILETKGMKMTDNVTIQEVTRSNVDNEAGTTVIIGGNE